LRRAEGLGVLVWVYFLSQLAGFVYPAVWAYVGIAKFDWTEGEIGVSLVAYGVLFVVCQAVVTPFLMPRIGERRVIWIAFALEAVALIGLATAPSPWVLYLWLLPALFTGMEGPALQKVMTERTPPDAQGELQGGLSGLGAIVLILSPLIYTQLFFAFQQGVGGLVFPGAPFVMAAVFNSIALTLFVVRKRQTGG